MPFQRFLTEMRSSIKTIRDKFNITLPVFDTLGVRNGTNPFLFADFKLLFNIILLQNLTEAFNPKRSQNEMFPPVRDSFVFLGRWISSL